jgi:hypothetical protein
MKRSPHPLEEGLKLRVRLLATTLRPATVRIGDTGTTSMNTLSGSSSVT